MIGRLAVVTLAVAALSACASGAKVMRGDGPSVAAIQALSPDAALRIAVAPVLDRAGPLGMPGLDILSLRMPLEPAEASLAITSAVRDMLITELVNVPAFIVLDRELLDAAAVERAFNAPADQAVVDTGTLEGAEFLVLAAVTAFDPDASGGALPIPVPLGTDGAFGLIRIGKRKSAVAMDLRLVDVATGRVVHSVAVQGGNARFGADFDLFIDGGRRTITLPSVLKYFDNTPVEAALQEMTLLAVAQLAVAAAKAHHGAEAPTD